MGKKLSVKSSVPRKLLASKQTIGNISFSKRYQKTKSCPLPERYPQMLA